VLLDEIEKAHPEVFNVLLQVLDDGRLTDGQGRTVDFRNTVVVMTSNLGSDIIQSMAGEEHYQRMKSSLMDILTTHFRPEFINRVDEIVVFRHLQKKDMVQIVDIVIEDILAKISDRQISIALTNPAKEFIADHGFDPVSGARPLKRTIQKFIEDPIAEEILKEAFSDGSEIEVRMKAGKLEFTELSRKPVNKNKLGRNNRKNNNEKDETREISPNLSE